METKSTYVYNEYVKLAGRDDVFTVVTVKKVSLPNGKTSFMYKIQSELGEIEYDGNNPWFHPSELRKCMIPSEFSFEVLMDHLKNDIIQRDDIQ